MLFYTKRLLKRAAGKSWRLDETYVKVKREWKYLYRAIDKEILPIGLSPGGAQSFVILKPAITEL